MSSRSRSAAPWRRNGSRGWTRSRQRYGVDRNILLAIWVIKSNYGEILKNDKVMRNVVRSLATLAYADRSGRSSPAPIDRRAQDHCRRGDIDERHLMGSWAGAMGPYPVHPDLLSGLAVDMDGNGHRDIWNSVPDALATAANLLKKNGWQAGKTLGLRRWRCLPAANSRKARCRCRNGAVGVTRPNGKPFLQQRRQGRTQGAGRARRALPS